MARGVVDLIQENKKRFYAGEIRNSFYENTSFEEEEKKDTVVVDKRDKSTAQRSFWKNIKLYSQKFSADLFYEPVK